MNDTPYNPAAAFVPEGDDSARHPHLHLRTWPLPADWTGTTSWGWTDVGKERTYAVHAEREHTEVPVQVFECRRRQDLEAALGIFAIAGALVQLRRSRDAV